MTARRITGRAAAMATFTVLFAGAAAAAAGGVLPGPFSGGNTAEVAPTIDLDPSSTDPATSGPLTTEPTGTDVSGSDDSVITGSPLPEAYGLCTAWHAGHEKKADNPAFSKLQHAADEMNGSVEEYCEQVFADKDASRQDDTDSTEVDDDSTDDDSDDAPDDSDDAPDSSDPSGGHGSSNGGNSGNGNGNGPKG